MTINNINRSQFQFFPYHLVTPSPWPILVSFSLLTAAIGAVMYFHGYNNGGNTLTLGLGLVTAGMILWFRDVITEGTHLGDHTKEVKNGLLTGFLLFIVSELFAFLSVFWAFFHSSLAPAIEIGGTWPPQGILPLDPFAIPLLNTILLVSSGAFITYGHHALIKGDRAGAIVGAFLTILFAVIFTILQYYEYVEAPFSISDCVFGSVFFASTGLHGAHVIIGTLFLSVGLQRLLYYHFTTTHHQGYESAIYYWHFVDIVWLFLYLFVYFWSGSQEVTNLL